MRHEPVTTEWMNGYGLEQIMTPGSKDEEALMLLSYAQRQGIIPLFEVRRVRDVLEIRVERPEVGPAFYFDTMRAIAFGQGLLTAARVTV